MGSGVSSAGRSQRTRGGVLAASGCVRVASFESESTAGTRRHRLVPWALLVLLASTSAIFLRAAVVAQGATPGLVAAYSFDEGAGTTVADASGTGNAGTIGSATWTTQGKYGNALTFNGTSARVTVPDAPSLRLTGGMTLEAWIYPTASTLWKDAIYKGNDNYYLRASRQGRPAAGGIFAGSYAEAYGSSNLAANTWTHLAATYDGSIIRLYVNGVQVATQAKTGAIATSSNPLTIGGDPIYGQSFHGRIDDVRIYNRALTRPRSRRT